MTEQSSAAVVYLDSMAFILAIEGVSSIAQPVRQLFAMLRTHPGAGITSELTLAEVLAGSEIPLSPAVRRDYLDLIVSSAFLELVPISREFLWKALICALRIAKATVKNLNWRTQFTSSPQFGGSVGISSRQIKELIRREILKRSRRMKAASVKF
jgi:hypothetical protein